MIVWLLLLVFHQLLRCINFLEGPDAGTISVAGITLSSHEDEREHGLSELQSLSA